MLINRQSGACLAFHVFDNHDCIRQLFVLLFLLLGGSNLLFEPGVVPQLCQCHLRCVLLGFFFGIALPVACRDAFQFDLRVEDGAVVFVYLLLNQFE